MRRVLGRATSSNVMKVVWLLEELGIEYRREDFGGAFGGTATPEYRAMNPNGIVPTLVEDDFVLWESNAILRYLASGHAAGTRWCPADPHQRARIDQWMDWQQTVLGPPMAAVFWGMIRTAPDKRDQAAIAAAAAKLEGIYGIIEAQLGRHAFVAGPDLSPADVAISPHVHRWFNFEMERPAMPALRAWYDRLLTRPAFAKHVARPLE